MSNDPVQELWGCLEIMGHQQYFGRISEYSLAGHSFIRIDIPGNEKRQPMSKMFGPQAV